MPNQVNRNFNLDVLRGLAILLVIVHHIALPFRLKLSGGVLEELFGKRLVSVLAYSGQEAVMLFFVLSGFLITRRSLQLYGRLERIDWLDFYARRTRRIVPLLAVLLVVLSVLHALEVPHFRIKNEGQTWLGALFAAVFLHLNWYEGQTTWLPAAWDVLWSLSIEEVFYLAFPWLCLFIRSPWLLAGMLALAASMPITRGALAGQEIWQDKAYLPGFAAIACGVSAAILVQQGADHSKAFWRWLAGIGGLGLVATLWFGNELWRTWGEASLLLHCAAAALASMGLQHVEPSRWAAMALGWLARMGQLSYELYLTHMLVVIPCVAAVQRHASGYAYWYAAMAPPIVLLCFVFARLCQRWISEPLGQRMPVRR
jgi:peptidoglycan/LPS O-acetylase OafA/YrhL